MKVVALVSGGKDSCYTMMECVSFGHEVVAIANLCPPTQEQDELDSFMFQTVGHHAIATLAQAMGVPLVQQPITGGSSNTHLIYERTDGDEVEDLYSLLRRVQEEVPEVEAVASGAIKSTYQRARVECVARRLGLTSLAYLWNRDQPRLLADMIASQLHAVLVKVACMGLSAKHVNKSLAQIQALMHKLAREYGANVCGEGGEYESFTLDCPLFEASVVVDEAEVVCESLDPFSPVAYTHFVSLSLGQPKAEEIRVEQREAMRAVHTAYRDDCERKCWSWVPSDLAATTITTTTTTTTTAAATTTATTPALSSATVFKVDTEPAAAASTSLSDDVVSEPTGAGVAKTGSCVNSQHNGRFVTLFGLRALNPGASVSSGEEGDPVRQQFESIAEQLTAALELHGLTTRDVVAATVTVADLSSFASLNSVYGSLFPHPLPPCRATVEAGLDAGVSVTADFLAYKPSADAAESENASLVGGLHPLSSRLHVESISHWAPANIGPYSQSARAGPFVTLAGMIGLDPPTMTLVCGGLVAETVRSLNSIDAVLSEVGCGVMSVVHLAVFLVDCSAENVAVVKRLVRAWRAKAYRKLGRGEEGSSSDSDNISDDGSDAGDAGDGNSNGGGGGDHGLWEVSTTYVGVTGLPRGAAVEIQATAAPLTNNLPPPTAPFEGGVVFGSGGSCAVASMDLGDVAFGGASAATEGVTTTPVDSESGCSSTAAVDVATALYESLVSSCARASEAARNFATTAEATEALNSSSPDASPPVSYSLLTSLVSARLYYDAVGCGWSSADLEGAWCEVVAREAGTDGDGVDLVSAVSFFRSSTVCGGGGRGRRGGGTVVAVLCGKS